MMGKLVTNQGHAISMEEELIQKIKTWSQATLSQLKGRASSYQFARKMKATVGKTRDKSAIKAGFQLPRYAVMRHKGVGRGRGINSGKTIPDPFLNEVLNNEIPVLSGIVAEHYQDLVLNSSRILIN
jgi:hypothetical protein